MHKIHFWFLAFLFVPILLVALIPHPLVYRGHKPAAQASSSASPTTASAQPTSSANSATPAPSAQTSCLGEDVVQSILGKTYSLQSETYFPDTQTLECSYQADDMIKDMMPSMSYTLITSADTSLWQAKQAELKSDPSYRSVDQHPDYFAEVNPVIEVAQANMYGKDAQHYIQLNYSPITESNDDILRKEAQLIDKILGK